jgi:hypothetical protein
LRRGRTAPAAADTVGIRDQVNLSIAPDELAKFVYLANLRGRNEALFCRPLADRIEEMLPIASTPTTGTAIEPVSHECRRTRGVHLSVNLQLAMGSQLRGRPRNWPLGKEHRVVRSGSCGSGRAGLGDVVEVIAVGRRDRPGSDHRLAALRPRRFSWPARARRDRPPTCSGTPGPPADMLGLIDDPVAALAQCAEITAAASRIFLAFRAARTHER